MALGPAQESESSVRPEIASGPEAPTTAHMLAGLAHFEGSPQEFLHRLLALQCRVGEAAAGAVLRIGPKNRVEVLAVHPKLPAGSPPVVWLAQAVEFAPSVIASSRTHTEPLHRPDALYGQPADRHLVLVPLGGGGGFQGLAVFLLETLDASRVAMRRERLEMTTGFLSLYELRLALQRRQADLARLRAAMEVLAAVNAHERFMAAAMTFCNETAARWDCDRVSIGFLKGRYVQLRAMSHTEKFARKMKLVQDIEAAAEECLDQDAEVLYPSDPESMVITRAAAELSKRHGPSAVLCLPLRQKGEPRAVLVLERTAERPFTIEETEALRLTCELCGARILGLHETDLWFGAKAARSARRGLAALLGPTHTWKKLAALAACAVLLLLVFAKGEYCIDAPFVLQAVERRAVPAPFDGYLREVFVEPNDDVEKDKTVLATLRTVELRGELATAKAQEIVALTKADQAMRDNNVAAAQIARAEAAQAAAQVRLIESRIEQATIVAPISGKVVSGDLKPRTGARVTTGDVLFEIAPITPLRAELAVPEDDVIALAAKLEERQSAGTALTGELATASQPGQRSEFVVDRINPVAEIVNRRNVFKVRAMLLSAEPWMRPGMEGIAKIRVDRRRYVWIWTRRLVNWLRMQLWL